MPILMRCRMRAVALSVVVAAAALGGAGVSGAPFTAGNVIVSRTGDGSTTLSSAAAQVSLVEIQSNGSATGNVIAMPTAGSSNGGGLTDSGSASSNGHLNRSADGLYLVLAGYDATVGTASVNGTTSSVSNRNAARVDGAGSVSVLARWTDAFSANNVRSATSENGSSFYMGGSSGVRWATGSTSPGSSTGVTTTGTVRDVVIARDANGNKYLLQSTNTAISYFDTELPTASGATATSLGITLTDAHAFALFDRSPTAGATGLGGLDTLYVADGSGTGGTATAVLRKFEWDGSAWTAAGTATLSTASSKLFGITGRVLANGSVELFATTQIASNNSLMTVTDSSNSNAFGGTLSGTLSVIASAGTNYAFRGVAFAPQPDLSVTASAPASGMTGVSYDYTLTVTNEGASTASGVGLQFTLPAGLTYVGATGAGFSISQTGGVVTFTGGTVAGGASATLTITVNPGTAGTYTANTSATVVDPTSAIAETNETNNSPANSTSTVVADAAELTVSVAAPSGALVGEDFNYTLTVLNNGLASASGVGVQFTLPAGLTYVSASGSSFSASESGGVVTFSGGSLAAGATRTLTVTVHTAVAATYTAPVGAAVVDPSASITEGNEANNSSPTAATTVVANAPDLSVTVSAAAQGLVGVPFSYTITAANYSAVNASDVTVRFTLPAGLAYVGASGAGFTAGESSGVVSFTGGSLNAGATATLTVNVTAATAGGYTAPIGAAVIDPLNAITEGDEGNNASPLSASTTVAERADLAVSLSAPATAYVGLPFDYTLTVQNLGLGSASGVAVQFTLPPGVAYTSASASGWSINASGGVVSFTGGSLNAGGSATLTVSVTASSAATLTASVGTVVADPFNAITESNEANNASPDASVTEAVNPADLVVSVAASGTGEVLLPFNYTITATNNGLGSASDVRVQFTLPPNLRFHTASGSGFSTSLDSGVVTFTGGTLAAGASVPLTVTVSTLYATTHQVAAGAAVIDPLGAITESSEANNASTETPSTVVSPAGFRFNSVVVYRVGDGTSSLVNTGSPVFVDEYSSTGEFLQSIALRTTASGAQQPLIASGTASSEGYLTRSADGKFLVLSGYGTTLGGSGSIGSTAANVVPRVVGRITGGGVVDTSTALTDFASGNNFRGVTSSNGAGFWVTGNFSGAGNTSTGGVHYATLGSTTSTDLTTTAASGTFTNARGIAIFDGQLYASGSVTALRGVGTIGTGLPTSGAQAVTRLPGLTDTSSASSNAFFLADLTGSVAGVDTLYIADDNGTTGGIKKFSFVNGSWVANGIAGNAADAYRGLTARVSGSTVTLYATRNGGSTGTGGGELVSLVDDTGYNATITTTAPTVLVTALTNTAFRGVALSPEWLPDLTVSVSAPATARGGVPFTYTITAANNGDSGAPATDLALSFTLPVGLTFSSATAALGFGHSESGGVVTFAGGTIPSGGSAIFTVNATASVADGTFTAAAGAAVIDAGDFVRETNESNNSSPAAGSTVITTPDLTVASTHASSFVAGDPGDIYTLTVTNSGTASTSGTVTVTDTLPTGLTAVSLAGEGWTIVQGTGGTVSATRDDALAAGASYPPLTLTVAVDLIISPSVTNTVEVSGGGELNTANNSATDATSILSAGPGVLAFSSATRNIEEEGGSVTLNIVRTSGRTGAVSVQVATADGTAKTPGDYTAVPLTTVEFAEGETSKSVSVTILDDSVTEPNETFNIVLSNAQGGATLGATSTATVRILERDAKVPTVTISTPAANGRVNEGPVNVTGTATDDKGVAKVQVKLNGGAFVDATSTIAANTLSATYTAPLLPLPGVNTVTVRSVDARGNLSGEVSRSFTFVVLRPLALGLLSDTPGITPGTVTISPVTALDKLELGKSYTLTATPKAGYVWNFWAAPGVTGAAAESNKLTFTMTPGLAITAAFLKNPFVLAITGEYNGLIKSVGPTPTNATNGHLTATVFSTGAFSGTIKIDGQSLAFNGAFDNGGQARFGTTRATSVSLARQNGKPPLTLQLNLDMNPAGTNKIQGILTEPARVGIGPVSAIEADRAAFDGRTPGTSTTAGFYTVAFPAQAQTNGLTTANFPQGDGIGTITLSTAGVATFNLTLADGTPIIGSTKLSKTKGAPLFAQLYSLGGSFGGQLVFDDMVPTSDVSSSTPFLWFKPRTGGQYYPDGWVEGVSTAMIGAKFAVPAGESVLPDLGTPSDANAALRFTGGDLPGTLEKLVFISPNNTVAKVPATDLSYSLTIRPTSGGIGGTFTHTDGSKPAYNGVILQKGVSRRAFGYFLTTAPAVVNGAGKSGTVSLATRFNPRPTLVISEFMAKNVSTIQDEDGAYSDWIEIYNPGSTTVDLTDWCLTDNASNLTKWRFPAVELGSRQFLLVWASSKNRRIPGQPLHTNFALSNDGEYLALVRPDGVTIEQQFAPTYPKLNDDVSYGINFTGSPLISQGVTARYLIPTNNTLGTTWTTKTYNHAAWRSGATGLGYGMLTPGLTVRQVHASGTSGGLGTVAQADALLALPKGHANIASEATVILPELNLLGDGSDGHYDGNHPLPDGQADVYVIHATGVITIPATGNYVFGLNSDDGGRIKIDGTAVMIDDSNHGPEDHLSAPVMLTAGTHTIDVIMWEGYGGDEVELYAAPGTETSWSSNFKLVGGAGGLAVSTPPLTTSGASGAVATNVQSLMNGVNPSCYVRVPFTAGNVSSLNTLTLRMRYNDGFVAWLNGTEVLRRNAPSTLAYNATATASRTAEDSLVAETIDLTPYLPLLISGSNVLAIQGLNSGVSDGTFLVLPELSGSGVLAGDPVYFTPGTGGLTATPGTVNGVPPFLGKVADPVFSVKHGFYDAAFSLAITTPTLGAQIRYTLDGSTPTSTTGTLYTAPLSISRTSIVRALAFKTNYEPGAVVTQSYLFLNDVIRQSPTGVRPGVGWQLGTVNGQVSDYGMDPEIVNSTNPEIGGVTTIKNALRAIPTVSLVTDLPNLFDPSTGIYSNPYARGFQWERPASLELIGDEENSAEGGFQINCGVRTRGGYSRSGDNPKHSFHVYFRSVYGKSKLKYPLFGDEGVDSFDQIDLRTSQNYSWSFGGDGNNTFMREETTRELQGAMGQPYSRGRYYHLYINGQYWGLYNSDERTEADFSESYLGGEADDYDVVKAEQDSGYITGVTDGNLDAWTDLWNKAQAHAADPTNENYFKLMGRAADGVTPTADPVLLDVDNLIDYMLLTFWTGNLDGATSAFLGENCANNWFASRNRTGSEGFRFFAHDFEHTFFNVDENRTGPFASSNSNDLTYSNPMWVHHDLRPNLEYRVRWGDRVQQHMFTGGALTADSILTRMTARAGELDRVIAAESARWGDAKVTTPYTRLSWQSARDGLLNYVPNRGSRVLAQLREDGLYPSFDAPTLSQHGGPIANGSEVIITGYGGTIYLTLDGSDPRLLGGAVNSSAQTYTSATFTETPVAAGSTWKYLADGSDQGTAWRSGSYDDSAWLSGAAELGYGDGDEATVVPYVDTDPGTGGDQKNATTYFRQTFSMTDVNEISAATLHLKYDDSAVIYVNGVEAARTSNLPTNPGYSQFASGDLGDNATADFTIDPDLLVNGTNTIAVEVHQASAGSSDISFQLSLEVTRTQTPTPLILSGTGAKRLKVRALNAGEWSALVDASFNVVNVPDLRVTATSTGTFATGGSAACVVTVANTGTASSSGVVSVMDTLPAGLTATGTSGSGWSILQGTGSTVIATRSDALAPGGTYPDLTINVAIAMTAAPSVTNSVSVSATGELNTANNADTDDIAIAGSGTAAVLFSAGSHAVPEEVGVFNVPIIRSGSRAGAAQVILNTVNGTAKAPGDFSAQQNVAVDFADGEWSKSVPIPINGDGVTEGDETFTVTLSNATGAALGSPATTTVRILEADAVLPVVSLSTPAAAGKVTDVLARVIGTATDNKGIARVQVALNGGAFTDIPFTLNTTGLVASYNAPLNAVNGANTVVVRALDYRGNTSATVSRTFTFVPLRPLSLTVAPSSLAGTVSITPAADLTKLQVGATYTLKAKAATGFLFDHWTAPGVSGVAAEYDTLKFTMTEGMAISATFVENPFKTTVTGAFNGLVHADTGVTRSNATEGFINVTVQPTGGFSGTLKMDGLSLSLSGLFDNTGRARFGPTRENTLLLTRSGKPSLVLVLNLDLNLLGTHTITGTVGETLRGVVTPLCVISADRAAYSAVSPLPANSPYLANKGFYTVILPATLQTNGLTVQDYPMGTGVGTITLTAAGNVSFTGTLGDGTAISASAPLSAGLSAPLYAQLYTKNGGCFRALVVLDDSASDSDLKATDAQWFRPWSSAQHYPWGWPEGVTLDLLGAKYAVPSNECVVTGLGVVSPNAHLVLARGGLVTDISKSINISTTNVVTKTTPADTSYSLTLIPSTGRISGDFLHPMDNTRPKYNGIIYRKGIGGAHGYFLTTPPAVINGTGLSGRVEVKP